MTPLDPHDPEQIARQAAAGEVARIQKALRRRFLFLLTGGAIAIVGLQIDPAALGIPVFVPALVSLFGGLVGLGGLLGLRRGAGCLAQILFFVWLGALTCSAGSFEPITLQVLTGALVMLVALSLLLPRRQYRPVLGARAARESRGSPEVIDVEAREVDSD